MCKSRVIQLAIHLVKHLRAIGGILVEIYWLNFFMIDFVFFYYYYTL